MTASTPDLTKLEAEMREKALAATLGVWRMCGHARGGCSCGEVWALACDAPVATAQIGEWEGGSISEFAGRANAAHIAASCPSNVIAVLDGKDAEIARLTRERDAAQASEDSLASSTMEAFERLETRANAAEARVAELVEALRPFANLWAGKEAWGEAAKYDLAATRRWDGDRNATVGDLRGADLRRAAGLVSTAPTPRTISVPYPASVGTSANGRITLEYEATDEAKAMARRVVAAMTEAGDV